jgi:predicted ribosome quality control (RQC) complex YloA/Tae2 family protein
MNASLLARFAREAREQMIGCYLGTPQWYPPVLAISYARDRYLVAVLEAPGPFCFPGRRSPFEGARAPERMDRLGGAEIQEVSCLKGNRVLQIDVVTRGREYLTLSLVMFGSAGVAFVARDGVPAETVGRGSTRFPDAPEPVASAPPLTPPFRLIITRQDGAAEPATPEMARAAPEYARVLGPFSSALDACEVLGQRVLDGAHETIIRRVTRPARRKVEALRRLAANLEADIATAASHDEQRRVAETLAAYQTRISSGATHVDLPDIYDPERTLSIDLDPTDPIHVQIEKRFRRVSKLEKSLAHSARRLDVVRRESTELEASLRLLDQARTFSEALKLVEAIRAKFSIRLDDRAPPVGRPREKKGAKTYRQFELNANWYAIVGRSNNENDEITFKVAAPGDLWFHAHNVPGSHVVLKSRGGQGGAPAAVIERAAAIAAHFSKARHSKLVPVIYTQRRYVRKFRGASPGEVTCEREKMVMIPPRLPETESEQE